MAEFHIPVMLTEVLRFLEPRDGQTFVDCTVGGGGHALQILKRIVPAGRLVGIDRDEAALRAAADRLAEYSSNLTLVRGNFSDLRAIAYGLGIQAVDGVLFDLGVSSHQLESAERGFSFRYDAPLDMRMDTAQALTARELVNSLSERRLAELIWRHGEDRWAKRIAKFIVDRRARRPVETTGQLVEAILAAVPARARGGAIHLATRTFQALRIAVNNELESLRAGLEGAIQLLTPGGGICILSYHSLEDRIAKRSLVAHSGRCVCPPALPACVCGAKKELEILTKRPVVPSAEEIAANPRARSARLRAARKL
ncbi:MAG: 16S rRNA (cytosine(1402)-N(4))-methyltransferase RsmH [Armatimonadetes bacterium]|nr:16S rRNA (cytosine(1402)-N(4))-methyltransferase RsmH [Armatimonadota bacterium]NIM23020.1 16S rRNA (cytosine(1402)-N(4))-methyltransferase RsmH [Armatimonadota bacterium]NIM66888.1 16S rRNA (cytosine(1402)-N(4))-methyltransferase RsmH [Armatimonadota bacterium]NIN05079.1 16S rRNA (cytosine(1402)-N(4))-methyltransferase RsmH [Armatimonadota bacterium]NIO96132.1 16S rRNA (cytosine(1402)-N(4))-methyltransferase RsmH [Armatimonadota bacterium]